ncbi:MAG TPA: amidohydrolase, partial [Sphingomonas sp.]|nr:amidohydrolase [Sphingomonas sp.]
LTVRSYSKETRQHLLDGIRRIARGEALAAGLPEELMPVVAPFGTPGIATYNDEPLANRLAATFKARFGDARVTQTKPVMVSEDFPQYREADPQHIQSTLFWVGGVPQAKWDAVGGDPAKLPSLHSPFWAPDADKVIATGTEAMVAAAMDLLAKK